MPVYQLSYLSRPGVAEVVDADGLDDAEELARRRLLFSEPGFAIAILFDGVELNRVVQRRKVPGLRFSSCQRAAHSPGRATVSGLGAGSRLSEQFR